MKQQSPKQSKTYPAQEVISRSAIEVALLHEAFEPGYLREVLWPQISTDPRFVNFTHGVLELASKIAPGHSAEAIAKHDAMIIAATLAVASMLDTVE